MSIRVHFPDEVAERLAAEAERRNMSIDDLATELVRAGLRDTQPMSRRRLAFAAFGASGSSRGGAEAEEILAEGFGLD